MFYNVATKQNVIVLTLLKDKKLFVKTFVQNTTQRSRQGEAGKCDFTLNNLRDLFGLNVSPVLEQTRPK